MTAPVAAFRITPKQMDSDTTPTPTPKRMSNSFWAIVVLIVLNGGGGAFAVAQSSNVGERLARLETEIKAQNVLLERITQATANDVAANRADILEVRMEISALRERMKGLENALAERKPRRR